MNFPDKLLPNWYRGSRGVYTINYEWTEKNAYGEGWHHCVLITKKPGNHVKDFGEGVVFDWGAW